MRSNAPNYAALRLWNSLQQVCHEAGHGKKALPRHRKSRMRGRIAQFGLYILSVSMMTGTVMGQVEPGAGKWKT